MLDALSNHWPEYVIEGSLLGLFMFIACAAVSFVEHPGSALRKRLRSPIHRRALIGTLMGLTAICLIYSPTGQRSGAHMNPATTIAYFFLGKIAATDAMCYVVSQFAGGVAGVGLARLVLDPAVSHPSVNYAVTLPGPRGSRMAWAAEFVIAYGMMTMVLMSSNREATAPYTGVFAGFLLFAYITFEAPLSGMSLNPARTLASALAAGEFRSLWVYFTAPPLAMVAAAAVYAAVAGRSEVFCAKLSHPDHGRCIFDCHINELQPR